MADEQNYVSMLDLEADTEALLGFNPEADANAMVPPIPAMKASVVVRFTEEDPEKRWKVGIWGKDQQKTYFASVTATLYNSAEYDGRTVRGNVSTFTMERSGTNSIQGLLQACGLQQELQGVTTRKALVTLLNETIGAGDGAPCECEIDWEANEQVTDEEKAKLEADGKKPYRLQGMKRFPVDTTVPGTFQPVVNYKGVDLRAYNVIKRWITPAKEGVHVAQTMSAPKPASASAPQPASNAPTRVPQTANGAASQAGGPPVPARATTRAAGPVPAGTRR